MTFAAELSRANDVVLLARRLEVAQLIAREGIALVRDQGKERIAVRATADAQDLADRDACIIAVKAYATEAALGPLRGVLGVNTLIASVQNGVENVANARLALPGARVVAGSTTQGAIRVADGWVHAINRGTTVFARSDADTPSSEDLAAAFTVAGLPAHVTDDVDALLWGKLVVNAAINPLGALSRATNGGVIDDPDLQPLARMLALEAASVASAEGANVWSPWQAVEAAARETAVNRNSMLQDLEAGRPTEIEAICGTIVRRAHHHGFPVPVTETMLHLVRARERA